MVNPIEPGERVAVVLNRINEKKHKIYFVGYGKYDGLYECPNSIKKLKKLALNKKILLGRITLENGGTAWLYNCWIHRAERFDELFIEDIYKEGWKVINVDLNGKFRKI